MDLIRIPIVNLRAAADGARLMGLQIDQVVGDDDGRYINIGARRAGSRGNHERRWTPHERAALAQLIKKEYDLSLTLESRIDDEIAYFGGGLTNEELQRYQRRTTNHPLFWLTVIAASPLVVEGLCRLSSLITRLLGV